MGRHRIPHIDIYYTMMFVEDRKNTYLVGPVQIILSLSRKVREALPSVYLSSVEGQIDIL